MKQNPRKNCNKETLTVTCNRNAVKVQSSHVMKPQRGHRSSSNNTEKESRGHQRVVATLILIRKILLHQGIKISKTRYQETLHQQYKNSLLRPIFAKSTRPFAKVKGCLTPLDYTTCINRYRISKKRQRWYFNQIRWLK